ncbi:reverse transcriptase domain-containing protein [Tanacetum coccineum]
MPNNVKTYDGTRDPEDHVKFFQAAAQVEHWAMLTWCHMFNSTRIGTARVWFDELPPEIIDGYKDLKAAFLTYFMQQKKYVKDPVEIHNIKQRDGETIEDFMERFKVETGCMKGAPECMQIFGFMHGVNSTNTFQRPWKKCWQSPLPSYEENLLLLPKRKVTPRGNHKTSPSDMFQRGNLTSEVSQGKEGGPTGLPPYQNTQRNPRGRSGKVQTTTTHGHYHPYNGIIGRPGIREIQAVPSKAHRMPKFPVDREIVTIRSTILIPTKCATVTTSSKNILKEAEVRHENFKVALHPNFPDQEVAIGGTLSAKGRTELCSLLKENLDIFAWQSSDMTGVLRFVAEHLLNIREGYSSVRQKKMGQAPERAKAIQAEAQKLVEA